MTPGKGLSIASLGVYRTVSGAWRSPVIIACSGGVDSSALVVVACEALRRGKVAPFVTVHVDHRSRPESASEAVVVRDLCRALGVPFISTSVADSELTAGRSIEDLWRQRRYQELSRVADSLGVSSVVTAHTLGDQIETVLMRVFSGSAPHGMQPESCFELSDHPVTLVRPLLGTTRSELNEVLETASITPIIDPTNEDTSYRRNAVRHDVVPVLQRVFPGFEKALLRSVELLDRDTQYCNRVAVEEYARMGGTLSDGISLNRATVRRLDRAIASRVVRLAAIELTRGEDTRELTFERIAAVLRAAEGRTGARIELPYKITVRIERDAIVMTRTTKGIAVD